MALLFLPSTYNATIHSVHKSLPMTPEVASGFADHISKRTRSIGGSMICPLFPPPPPTAQPRSIGAIFALGFSGTQSMLKSVLVVGGLCVCTAAMIAYLISSRLHRSLRITPAMESNLTDHVCAIAELMA